MKKKTLEDFYKPVKLLKLPEKCGICGSILQSTTNEPHTCQIPQKAKKSSPIPEIFKKLMSTSQSSQKSNFHLEYQNFSEGRHKWSYSFIVPESYTYKSKVHNLKKESKDPTSIHLTFTTTHKGSPVHYFNFSKRPLLSPSLLKSILHKAIRRLNVNSSLKTSLQLGVNCG